MECGRITVIVVLMPGHAGSNLPSPNPQPMTIGNRTAKRTQDRDLSKVIDHRTRSILNAILSEPGGKRLDAYLRATNRKNS
jgi:hypothetical protein